MHKQEHKKPRILFILKLRQTSGYTPHNEPIKYHPHELKSSGLLNSAMFVKDMLRYNGYEAKLVEVVDNNSIDKEVHAFKPDLVIIEALWVVPEKFAILRKLHPHVKWVVRVHSEVPFLSGEGVAMKWINEYIKQKNVYVSLNSHQTYLDFVSYVRTIDPSDRLFFKLIYFPNYYPVKSRVATPKFNIKSRHTINVGCFGAVRPMKNHLIQAFAAVKFADKHGLKCLFHINAGRVERGDEVLKNLRNFFDAFKGHHQLVEHQWLDRPDFLKLIRRMDIGLQVSFSETFNIVAADFVSESKPIVTSREIDWMPKMYTATPTDVNSIVKSMERALWYDYHLSCLDFSRRSLERYVDLSEEVWLDKLNIML